MQQWDAIVIGSGAGGLTAALALARHGERVLVLEQHYLPGGWMQSFSLGGHRFSPGVHYLGECGPGGSLRNLYEGLGVARDLELCEMNPDGYDHLVIGDERIDVPRGMDQWRARLLARFPHERAGLTRYFDVLAKLASDVQRVDSLLSFPRVLALPVLAPTLTRWWLSTQASLLDRTIRDPILRAFLTAQNGDHGLSPARVSLPVHACTVHHYANGAYYPRGGAKSIPRALLLGLRRHGGSIRLRSRVSRILVERDRAVGVELADGERLHARHIISNADPHVTFGKLLPPGACPKAAARARRMAYSVSVLSVFAAVDMDLRARGFDSGNYWYYPTTDVAGAYDRAERALPGPEIESLFLAIPSLKDPSPATASRGAPRSSGASRGRRAPHTLEMFTFLPYDPWRRWQDTPQGARGPDYERLKEALADRVLAAAERVIPGLSRAVVFRSAGTPLTSVFYCESPFGAAYGTAKTPLQVGPFSHRTDTEIAGLHLCGASTLSHGVAGASISGLLVAQRILGMRSRQELVGSPDGSLRVYPADRPEEWLFEEPSRSSPPPSGDRQSGDSFAAIPP